MLFSLIVFDTEYQDGPVATIKEDTLIVQSSSDQHEGKRSFSFDV
jgi:hypothetical protein